MKSRLSWICPNCQARKLDTESLVCADCNWKARNENSVTSFLSDRDLSDPVMRSYYENYDEISDDDLQTPILEERYVEIQANRLLRYLTKDIGDLTDFEACDLGSGRGLISRGLVDLGVRSVVAVDISAAYLEKLRGIPKIKPVLANAENLPYADTFDLIVTTDVMEHVLNVGSFLFCANTSLRLGGWIVVRVPYRENLLQYSHQHGCKYRFVHLRTYDHQTLIDALEYAGFSVQKVRYDGFFPDRPNAFWTQTNARASLYGRIRDRIQQRIGDTIEFARLPNIIARPLMQPVEIVAIAKKKINLLPNTN